MQEGRRSQQRARPRPENRSNGRRDAGVLIGGRAEGGAHRAIIKLTRETCGTDVSHGYAGATDGVDRIVEGVIAVRVEELERPEVTVLEAPAHALQVELALRQAGIAAGEFLSCKAHQPGVEESNPRIFQSCERSIGEVGALNRIIHLRVDR